MPARAIRPAPPRSRARGTPEACSAAPAGAPSRWRAPAPRPVQAPARLSAPANASARVGRRRFYLLRDEPRERPVTGPVLGVLGVKKSRNSSQTGSPGAASRLRSPTRVPGRAARKREYRRCRRDSDRAPTPRPAAAGRPSLPAWRAFPRRGVGSRRPAGKGPFFRPNTNTTCSCATGREWIADNDPARLRGRAILTEARSSAPMISSPESARPIEACHSSSSSSVSRTLSCARRSPRPCLTTGGLPSPYARRSIELASSRTASSGEPADVSDSRSASWRPPEALSAPIRFALGCGSRARASDLRGSRRWPAAAPNSEIARS